MAHTRGDFSDDDVPEDPSLLRTRLLELKAKIHERNSVIVRQQHHIQNILAAHERLKETKAQLGRLLRGEPVTKYHNEHVSWEVLMLRVSPDLKRLTWSNAEESALKGRGEGSVSCDSIIGIIFGPVSQNFQRLTLHRKDYFASVALPWLCFSILTTKRTLDFSCESEEDVVNLILSVQEAMPSTAYLKWTRQALIVRRAWMKVRRSTQSTGHSLPNLLAQIGRNLHYAHLTEKTRTVRSVFNKAKPEEVKDQYGKAIGWNLLIKENLRRNVSAQPNPAAAVPASDLTEPAAVISPASFGRPARNRLADFDVDMEEDGNWQADKLLQSQWQRDEAPSRRKSGDGPYRNMDGSIGNDDDHPSPREPREPREDRKSVV